jgi:peptidoglycan/xylan/chitin deacetylase (PgdA/CDA1 family)
MIDKRFLRKLKTNLLPAAVSVLIIIFYLYIPFIDGHLNAQEEASGAGFAGTVKIASIAPIMPLAGARVKGADVNTTDGPGARINPGSVRTPWKQARGGILPKKEVITPSAPSAAFDKAVFFDIDPTKSSGIDTEPGLGAETRAARPAPGTPEISGHGTTKQKKSPARSIRAWPPDITRGDRTRMELSITFDGGYKATEAIEILNTLRQKGIKTTIFLTGLFIKRHPGITRLIVLDGHEVGNHTMNHPHLTEYERTFRQKTLPWVDRELLLKELKGAEEAFREATGRSMAPLWRAPYGEVNAELRAWAFSEGYLHIGWTYDRASRQSLDTLDWVYDKKSGFYLSSSEIKDRIVNFGREGGGARGGIILMHLGTERRTDKAAAVLGEMIDELMEMGYRFVRVSELIEGEQALLAATKRRRGAFDLGRMADKTAPDPS